MSQLKFMSDVFQNNLEVFKIHSAKGKCTAVLLFSLYPAKNKCKETVQRCLREMCESKRSSELVIVKRLGKVISLESRITALWLNTSANQRCCSFKFPFCPIIAGLLWTDDVIFCSDCNISDLQCRNWYKINLAVRIKTVMFLRCVLMLGKERKRKSLCKEMKKGNCNHIYKHQYFMLR